MIVRHQKYLTDMNSKKGTKEKNGSGRYTEVICDRIRSVYGCEGNSVTCKEKDDRTILSFLGVFVCINDSFRCTFKSISDEALCQYTRTDSEAQVLGCTILVSDCSGNREQVENGTDGILCQLSPEDISRKISELLENEEKCREYGKKATVRISDEQGDILKLFEIV